MTNLPALTKGKWIRGAAEWVEGDTAFLSVAFTWRLPEARLRAIHYRDAGYKVKAGGPAVYTMQKFLADVAECPVTRTEGNYPDAVRWHNPMATFASQGCPVNCYFCIVPAMQGTTFTLLPDFPVRPVLCDNNLSALPADYQDHIVARYRATGVQLLDANSGFEPRTFDEDVWRRWKPINRGPWRFASDDQGDRPHVERVLRMLKDVSPRKKQVYTMIGNEPFEACMERIYRVIEQGGEPYVQPEMKLKTLEKRPWVRFDWTEHRLKQVQRWANGWVWRKCPDFADYDSSIKTKRQRKIVMPQRWAALRDYLTRAT